MQDKPGDTNMAFAVNKLLFHRGKRLFDVLDATGKHIQGSCSPILLLFNFSCSCKGKRDTIMEGQGDKESFGTSPCARYPLAPCELQVGGSATGPTCSGITGAAEPSRWEQRSNLSSTLGGYFRAGTSLIRVRDLSHEETEPSGLVRLIIKLGLWLSTFYDL